jgi:hypothetical protein
MNNERTVNGYGIYLHINASSNITYLSIISSSVISRSLFYELAICVEQQMKARCVSMNAYDDVEQPAMWHQ